GYAVATDRVLLVGTGRIVVGVFADAPVSEESVIAAVPLSPSATLSTIVSHASPAVSASDERQNSSLPSNSVEAAPNDAITTAADDSDDRTTPAACRCFQEAGKNGAQPEPAQSVQCLCVAQAAC